MTSGLWGMDTAEARDHAAKMDGGVGAIQGVIGNIGGMLESTPWFGRYADQFVQDWHGQFAPQLNGVSNSLSENSAVLRRRADMQDEASQS